MEHCIVYFSSSVGFLQETGLATILQQSRHDNARTGITGILLFDRGTFVQVLEGEREAVEALYGRIERDKRHTNVTKVFDAPIDQRLFTNWSMGYKTISTRQLEVIRTMKDLHKAEWLTTKPSPDIILNMVKVIYGDSTR